MSGKIPMCWKCASKVVEPNADDNSLTLTGCKENKDIHDYDDAKKLCPLTQPEQKKNRTVILNREDVEEALHPNLFDSFLETLGVDPEASEVCLNLSPLDHNKKV